MLLSSSGDMSLEPWHVFVRVFSMLVSPRTARKESESQKVKTFEGDLGAVQKARENRPTNGHSWWVGPWPRALGLGIVEVKGVLKKKPNPSSCCFWISGNVLADPPTPKTYFNLKNSKCMLLLSQQVPMMPWPAVSSYTLKNQHGPFEMVKETPSFHTSESILFGVWLFIFQGVYHLD